MTPTHSALVTCVSISAILDKIEHRRYPAKNALTIQISFKLGLHAEEMSLLRTREIAALRNEFARGYKVKVRNYVDEVQRKPIGRLCA